VENDDTAGNFQSWDLWNTWVSIHLRAFGPYPKWIQMADFIRARSSDAMDSRNALGLQEHLLRIHGVEVAPEALCIDGGLVSASCWSQVPADAD